MTNTASQALVAARWGSNTIHSHGIGGCLNDRIATPAIAIAEISLFR